MKSQATSEASLRAHARDRTDPEASSLGREFAGGEGLTSGITLDLIGARSSAGSRWPWDLRVREVLNDRPA